MLRCRSVLPGTSCCWVHRPDSTGTRRHSCVVLLIVMNVQDLEDGNFAHLRLPDLAKVLVAGVTDQDTQKHTNVSKGILKLNIYLVLIRDLISCASFCLSCSQGAEPYSETLSKDQEDVLFERDATPSPAPLTCRLQIPLIPSISFSPQPQMMLKTLQV